MRMYAFHCGGDRSSRAFYDPLDDDFCTVVYGPYFFFLIVHPKGNVLFDTGMHPRWQRDDLPPDALGPHVSSTDAAPSRLGVLGISPSDISYIILSHMHSDHAGGLLYFPDSTVIVQSRELSFATEPPVYQADFYDRRDFEHDVKWLRIDGEHDIFRDGRIVVISTPGHTPGHQSAVVRLRSGIHVLAGDAHYLNEKMRLRRLPSIVWSADEMLASWLKLEALERDHGAKLIFTHELDFMESKPVPPDQFYQ